MNSEKNNIGESNTNSLPQMGMTTGDGNISNFSNFNNQVSNVDTKDVSVFDLMDNFNAISSNNQIIQSQESPVESPVQFTAPVQNTVTKPPEPPIESPVQFTGSAQNTVTKTPEPPIESPVQFTGPAQNTVIKTPEPPVESPVQFTGPVQNTVTKTPEPTIESPVQFTGPAQNTVTKTPEPPVELPVQFTGPAQNTVIKTPEPPAGSPPSNLKPSDVVSIISSPSDNVEIEALTKPSRREVNTNSLYVPPALNDAAIKSDGSVENSILTNVLNTNKTADSVDSNKKQKKEKKQKGKKKKIVVIMIMLIAFIIIILSLIACYFMFMKQDKLVCSMEDYSKEDFNFTEEITVNFKGRTMSNAQLVEQMDFTEIGLPKMDSYVTDAENQFDGLGYEISYVQGPTDFKIIMNFTRDNLVSWTGIDLKSTTKSNFKQELQNKGYTCK